MHVHLHKCTWCMCIDKMYLRREYLQLVAGDIQYSETAASSNRLQRLYIVHHIRKLFWDWYCLCAIYTDSPKNCQKCFGKQINIQPVPRVHTDINVLTDGISSSWFLWIKSFSSFLRLPISVGSLIDKSEQQYTTMLHQYTTNEPWDVTRHLMYTCIEGLSPLDATFKATYYTSLARSFEYSWKTTHESCCHCPVPLGECRGQGRATKLLVSLSNIFITHLPVHYGI